MRATLDGESAFEHDKVRRNGVPRILDQTDAVSGLPATKTTSPNGIMMIYLSMQTIASIVHLI